MGERTMKACLEEQLDVLREVARTHPSCGFSLEAWYDDGAVLEQLYSLDDHCDLKGATFPLAECCKFAYAWGYIEGAADMADLTVRELLDEHGLTFDNNALDRGRQRQKIRKVAK